MFKCSSENNSKGKSHQIQWSLKFIVRLSSSQVILADQTVWKEVMARGSLHPTINNVWVCTSVFVHMCACLRECVCVSVRVSGAFTWSCFISEETAVRRADVEPWSMFSWEETRHRGTQWARTRKNGGEMMVLTCRRCQWIEKKRPRNSSVKCTNFKEYWQPAQNSWGRSCPFIPIGCFWQPGLAVAGHAAHTSVQSKPDFSPDWWNALLTLTYNFDLLFSGIDSYWKPKNDLVQVLWYIIILKKLLFKLLTNFIYSFLNHLYLTVNLQFPTL